MSMKALILKAYGEPKAALEVQTVPKPKFDPSSDQLLVRVVASSLNPMDWMISKGTLKVVRDFPMPGGMGYDLSGIVESVGQKVSNFKPGDEVIAYMSPATTKGAMAEYVTISASLCARKPRSLSHEEASCLPVAGVTALRALMAHEGAKDVALIPAGMGGVGSIGIQLAKNYFGFKKVITTVSTPKVPLIKAAIPIVDQVIDYRTSKIESVIPDKSLDFVLDSTGQARSWVRFLNTTHPSGPKPSLISVVAAFPIPVAEEWWDIKFPWYMRGVMGMMNWNAGRGIPKTVVFKGVIADANPKDLEVLANECDRGMLKPIVGKVFPLDQAVEAFEVAESGKVHGKIVLKISEEY